MLHNGRRKEKIVCCPALNFPARRSSAPCILTHGVLNALSVFAPEPDYKTRCVIFRIPIVLAAAYAAYLLRRLPPLTSGKSCVRMEKNTEGD